MWDKSIADQRAHIFTSPSHLVQFTKVEWEENLHLPTTILGNHMTKQIEIIDIFGLEYLIRI